MDKMKKYRMNNPEKISARKAVFIGLRNKTIIKQRCFCGNKKSEAHHENYNIPLKITWLCKKHHILADKERIRKNQKLLTVKFLQQKVTSDRLTNMELHIKEKRIELIWALSVQDYTDAQIARMFNVNRSTIMRIISKKPANWKVKWIKVIK